MASIRDIETKLAEITSEVIYPNGTSMPSITNTLVKVAIGFPISHQLDIDLDATNSQVVVYPVGKSEKNITKFPRWWQPISIGTATLAVNVLNNEVIITGTVGSPQSIVITLNNKPYAYFVQPSDTLDSIAAVMAALIPNATSVGSVITINADVFNLTAFVSVQGVSAYESKRQTKLFYIGIYAPNPDDRETLGTAIEEKLGDIIYINFPDTTQGIVWYEGSEDVDKYEKSYCYRRDVIFKVEYPTMIYMQSMQIGGADTTLTLQSEL